MNWDDILAEDERARLEEERLREMRLRLEGVAEQLTRTKDGIFFLRWVMSECKVFEQEWPKDATVTAWNAGRRAFGLQILELCAAQGKADMLLKKESEDA